MAPQHECKMEDKFAVEVKNLRKTITVWLGFCVGAIVLLLVGYGAIGRAQMEDSRMITKINNDYAPLIIIQDISKDNRNLINILQMLPQTTKDDPRYIKAITESQEFQTEALRRASSVKRSASGGSSSMGSSQ